MKTKLPKPLGKKLLLDIPETTAGSFVVVQGHQVQEQGKVLAAGPDADKTLVGQLVHFKAWAVDIITIDGKKFYYLDSDSTALCGIVTT